MDTGLSEKLSCILSPSEETTDMIRQYVDYESLLMSTIFGVGAWPEGV